MPQRFWREHLPQLSALLTIVLVCVVVLAAVPAVNWPALWPLWALVLAFAAAFVALTLEPALPLTLGQRRVLLALMLVLCFAIPAVVPGVHFDFLAIFMIIWVAVLPSFVGLRPAMVFTLVLVVLWFTWLSYWQQRNLLFSGLLYGGFHLFALLLQAANQAEKRARLALAVANTELTAAQQVLKAQSAELERRRIARDLHDMLGHHLTAMTIKLEVANQACGLLPASPMQQQAQHEVQACRQLAKLLLADVRETVSTLRNTEAFDLRAALLATIEQVQPLQVECQWPATELPLSADCQQQLLLICQEALSNSLKHSAARHFYLHWQITESAVALTMSDDGIVAADWQWGNGLTGMQERVTQLRGQLKINVVEQHLQYQLRIPVDGERT